MLIGSDGLGLIEFEDFPLAETIGVIALALILFEGGLTAGWGEIRPVLRPAIGLALPGTLVTAIVTGLAASWLFDFSTLEGLLVGAIVSSTDGAAVFSLLRGVGAAPAAGAHAGGRGGLQRPDRGAARARVHRVDHASRTTGSSTCSGCSRSSSGIGLRRRPRGRLARRRRRSSRMRLSSPGLYPVASLAAAALAFGAADTLGGSGFLAVYLAGLALGSADIPAKRTVTAFHEGLAWVAQLGMFLTLGLLVFPAELDDVAWRGTLLALVVVFVARPLATAVATLGSRLQRAREGRCSAGPGCAAPSRSCWRPSR